MGGTGSYSYSLINGTLPTGLTLATTGLVSGTPSQTGSFSITARATDSQGCSSPVGSYSLTVLPLLTDLSPILYAQPSVLYGSGSMSVVVDVVELNGITNQGLITLKISQDAKLSLSLPTSATSVGGRLVSNGMWQLSGPQNGYYTLTTSEPVGAGNKLSVGLVGAFSAGASAGELTVSGTLLGGSGGEQRATNNTDAEKIKYFPQ